MRNFASFSFGHKSIEISYKGVNVTYVYKKGVFNVMLDLTAVDTLLSKASNIATIQSEKRRTHEDLKTRVDDLTKELIELDKKIDTFNRASTLLGNTTESTIRDALDFITSVINRALSVIFPEDPRTIAIEPSMYRDVYPHFNVVLYTGVDKKERSFKQSGTGLAQIISFLFTITLNDSLKARQLMVIDELLNGLHPDAKIFIRDIIRAVSNRYQFFIVEYGLDMGKQYLMKKTGDEATASYYPSNYYQDINTKHAVNLPNIEEQALGEES